MLELRIKFIYHVIQFSTLFLHSHYILFPLSLSLLSGCLGPPLLIFIPPFFLLSLHLRVQVTGKKIYVVSGCTSLL